MVRRDMPMMLLLDVSTPVSYLPPWAESAGQVAWQQDLPGV